MSEDVIIGELRKLHEKVDNLVVSEAVTHRGIEDINRRLDVSNGRLSKHDEIINGINVQLEGYRPVKTLLYSLVGVILISFIGALISMVLVQQ